MGKHYSSLPENLKDFIQNQHIFFVGSSPLSKDGHIHLSPKGLDSFRILNSCCVAYMDLVGSGNETASHIIENSRITIMFCSFDKVPNILRIYG